MGAIAAKKGRGGVRGGPPEAAQTADERPALDVGL